MNNYLNWSNMLKINDLYSIENEMVSSNSLIKHTTNITWLGKTIDFTFESNHGETLDIVSSLDTPWTSLIQITIAHKKDGEKRLSQTKIEYGKEKYMLIDSEYEFKPTSKYIKLTIFNKTWSLTPMEWEMNLKTSSDKSLDTNLRLGNLLRMSYQMYNKKETKEGLMTFKLNTNSEPILFTCRYLASLNKKEINVEYERREKYSFGLTSSGTKESGSVSLSAFIPILFEDPIKSTITYNIKDEQKHFITDSIVFENRYQIDALIENNSIVITSNCPYGQGSLKINWENTEQKKLIVVDFISPSKFLKNTYIKFQYESQVTRKYNLNLTYDIHKVTCEGILSKKFLAITTETNIEGLEQVNMKLDFSEKEIKGVFTKNSSTVKFSAKINFNYMNGEANLHFNTPIEGYESNSILIKYAVSASDVNILFNSEMGMKIFKFHIQSFKSEYSSKEITLDIQSPWERVEKVYFKAVLDSSSIKLNGNFNEFNFNSILKAKLSEKNATVMLTMSSNITNWTTFSVEANILLAKSPYTISLDIKHELAERSYVASFDLTETHFDLKISTPLTFVDNIKINGNYNCQESRCDVSFTMAKNEIVFKMSGYGDISSKIPEIKVDILSPIEMYNVEFSLNGKLLNEKSLNFLLKVGEDTSIITIYTKLDKTVGTASLNIRIPALALDSINVQLSYDLDNETKHLMLDMERGGITEKFYIESRITSNEFNIVLESPIENYRRILLNGQYEKYNNEYHANGKVINEDDVYRFEGKITQNHNGYSIATTLPITQYESLILSGDISNEKCALTFLKGSKKYEILVNYLLNLNKAYLKINTPFESISYLAIGGEYEVKYGVVNGNIFVHRNDEHLDMDGLVEISPKKSNLKFSLKSSPDKKYFLNAFYDVVSMKKNAGFVYENGDNVYKYLIETLYNGITHGYFKVYGTSDGYQLNGFEYKLKTSDITDTEAFITLTRTSKETTIGIVSKYNKNELTIKVQTPFKNYEEFGIESKLNLEKKEGSARIMIGNFVLRTEVTLQPDNIYLYIETPFKVLETFKFTSKYELDAIKQLILIEFDYNGIKYLLNGKTNISRTSPQIYFKILTPFELLNEIELLGKLDMRKSDELFAVGMTFNEIKYFFSFGYHLDKYKYLLQSNIISPIEGWKQLKFYATVDLDNEEKMLNINFEREGVSKSILLSGKFFDGEIDFDVNVPSETLSNFKAKGSLNRSKRSVEFGIMNDDHAGEIVANFNSLKIKATTPFEKAKDITFEISKNNKGGWFLNYQRNSNKVYFNFSAEPKKKGFTVTIESEIPGWELLALAGRIDLDEIEAYIEGSVDSGTVHMTGNGLFGDKSGSLTITAHTSFEKYQEVVTKIEYNAKRNIFTFDSQSNSSEYKILVEFKRGLFIDVFVPNDEQNTVAKGKLTIFKGNLNVSSRFSLIKTFSIDYEVVLGPKITSKSTFERNGLKFFELEFERDSQSNTAHLMIHGRRKENHSMLHFHREGWTKLEFIFSRNGKEFKADITGSDSLPVSGEAQFTISNSFREIPRTVTGTLTVDRTSSPKKLHLEVQYSESKVYSFDLTYDFSFQNVRQGNFVLKSVTPDRSMAPWKSISGEWSFDENNHGTAVLRVGPREHTATGTIGIFESDLVFKSNILDDTYYVQWKFDKRKNSRDYFFKFGTESRFVYFKLKGTFDTIFNGDIAGAFRIAPIMQHDFNFTSKWSRSSEGLTGDGTFEVGDYSGTHTLTNLKRNPEERSATFHWEAHSNIPNFNSVVLHGEYSLARRLVDIKLSWDTEELSLKGSLDDMNLMKSENTIRFHIPKLGDGELTLSHDFSNPYEGYIKALGHIGSAKTTYILKWTLNKELTRFHLETERDSPLTGRATLNVDFNLEDLNDAKGTIEYNLGGDKYATILLSRKKADTHLKDEIEFKSNITPFPSARLYLNADWSEDLKLDSGIQWNDKVIESHLTIGPKSTIATVTTPFEKFGNINVNIDYDLQKPKSKTVVFKYARGDQVVDLNFNLKTVNKKTGSLTLVLTSPFAFLKNLNLDANWKKGDFTAVYQRNDKTYNVEGKSEVKADLSSFELKFTLPNKETFEIEFAHDLETFIHGTGSEPVDLISTKLKIKDEEFSFHVKGFRNTEKIYLEIDQTSSGLINTFHLKLDSELNLNKREGQFELRANEFHFNLRNTFERKPNGFYARSQIDSTLTALPGLTIGFGRDGDSFILTTGWGDEREITFTLKGKDHFKKGFYGTIDLPRREIHGLEYSVSYGFKSDSKLQINVKVELGEGREADVEIAYNSDGVKARLSSPWTGTHSARARRSISGDYYMADIGIDNYGVTFESDNSGDSFKKGFKIEGEIFGEKLFISGFANINSIANSEGKLIIETPFKNFEKLGGYFKTKLSNQRYEGELDLNMFSPIRAKVDIDLLDKVKGDSLIQLGNLIYEVSCDFTNDNGAMKGKIVINTPHQSFERLVIDGTITALSEQRFEGSFTTEYLSNIYNVDIHLKREDPIHSVDVTFRYNQNEYRISTTYSLIKYPFSIKGNALYYVNGNKMYTSNYEVAYKSIKDMHVSYRGNYKENSLAGILNFEATEDKIKGELWGNLSDQKKINLNINIPTHFEQVSIDGLYMNGQTHKMNFEITKEISYKKITLDINSPVIMNANFELKVYENSMTTFKTTIDTPNGQSKFNLDVESKRKTDNSIERKIVNNIFIALPFFENTYSSYMKIETTSTDKELIIRAKKNDEVHSLHGRIEKNGSLNTLHITAESHLLPGNASKITVLGDFDSKIKIYIDSYLFDVINNLYLDVSKDYGITLSCVSPLLPSGMAKIEGNLNFDTPKYTQFKFTFANAYTTVSSEGRVKWNVDNETEMYLELRTPYEEYKKMEFGIDYVNKDLTSIKIFAKPFSLEAESYFGIESSVFSTGIKVKTDMKDYELTKAEVVVPLTKFEPKFSAYFKGIEYKVDAMIEKTTFGGEFSFTSKNVGVYPRVAMSYRNKAPFELNYDIQKISEQPNKFGIKFDSSFLVFKDLGRYLIMF